MKKEFILIFLFILFGSCKDNLNTTNKVDNNYLLEIEISDFHINDSLVSDAHLVYGKMVLSTPLDSVYIPQFDHHFNYRPILIDSSYFDLNNKFLKQKYFAYEKTIVCFYKTNENDWLFLTSGKKHLLNLIGMAEWPKYEKKPHKDLLLSLPIKVKGTEIEKLIEIPKGAKRIFVY